MPCEITWPEGLWRQKTSTKAEVFVVTEARGPYMSDSMGDHDQSITARSLIDFLIVYRQE